MLPAYANIPVELKACLRSQEVALLVHKIPPRCSLHEIPSLFALCSRHSDSCELHRRRTLAAKSDSRRTNKILLLRTEWIKIFFLKFFRVTSVNPLTYNIESYSSYKLRSRFERKSKLQTYEISNQTLNLISLNWTLISKSYMQCFDALNTLN